jgi:hypothetical protein
MITLSCLGHSSLGIVWSRYTNVNRRQPLVTLYLYPSLLCYATLPYLHSSVGHTNTTLHVTIAAPTLKMIYRVTMLGLYLLLDQATPSLLKSHSLTVLLFLISAFGLYKIIIIKKVHPLWWSSLIVASVTSLLVERLGKLIDTCASPYDTLLCSSST